MPTVSRPGIRTKPTGKRPVRKELPKRSWLRVVVIERFQAFLRSLGGKLLRVGR